MGRAQGSRAPGRGWRCLHHPEPVSDALMFSRGFGFGGRVEEVGSLSP